MREGGPQVVTVQLVQVLEYTRLPLLSYISPTVMPVFVFMVSSNLSQEFTARG